MALRTFWSVRHVYLAFCGHDMTLSKNVLIDDRDLRIFRPVKLVFACHCLIYAQDIEDVFWSVRHVLCLLVIEAYDCFCYCFKVSLLASRLFGGHDRETSG